MALVAALIAALTAAAISHGGAPAPPAARGDEPPPYPLLTGEWPFSPPRPYRIDDVQVLPVRQTLVVTYVGGACDGRAWVAVDESAHQVSVTIWIAWRIPPWQPCITLGIGRTLRVHLEAPLGERDLIDGARLAQLRPVIPLRPGRVMSVS